MFESSEPDQLEPNNPGVAAMPPVLTSEYEPTSISGKWTAGTLVYTTSGLIILFCWLLWGDFTWSMKERSVFPLVSKLLRNFGASDTFFSILTVSLPPLITLLIGPIVSYRSDRHRGRWGRRIPYLLAPTPLALLAMIGLAYSPAIGRHFHASNSPNRSTLLCFGFFWTLFEVSSITVYSVFNAFVNDVVPRPVLGRFYAMFRALSLVAGIIWNQWIWERAEAHYVVIFVSIGLLYFFGFSLMCFKVKEGQYPPPDDVNSTAPKAGGLWPAIVGYCKDCFTQPYYLWVFGAIVLPGLAFVPINFFNLYFSQKVGMPNARYGHLQAFYFLLSILQAFPLGWLIDRYNPMRVAMVALVLHGTASFWGGFYSHTADTFAIAYVATGTLSGTWFTATAALNAVLFPKLKFAQYASASAVLLSIGTVAFGLVMGPFLDHVKHDYSYTYLAGGILDVMGLIATIIVFRLYLKLGGPNRYVAP